MILDCIGCLGSSDEVLSFLQRLSKDCSLQKKRWLPTFTKILKYHLFSVWLTCGWYIINCSNSHYCHEIFLCNNKVSLQINNRQYSSNIKRLKWVGNISNRNIFLCHVFDTMCMCTTSTAATLSQQSSSSVQIVSTILFDEESLNENKYSFILSSLDVDWETDATSLFGILDDKAVLCTLKVCVGIPCFLIYN